MQDKRLRYITFITTAYILLNSLLYCNIKAAAMPGANTLPFNILLGMGRFHNSINVSQAGSISSQYIILASWRNFSDALLAGSLSARLNVPVYFSGYNDISMQIVQEIHKLSPSKIIIIGDINSIPPVIENRLKESGLIIERIQGIDRYLLSYFLTSTLNLTTRGINTGYPVNISPQKNIINFLSPSTYNTIMPSGYYFMPLNIALDILNRVNPLLPNKTNNKNRNKEEKTIIIDKQIFEESTPFNIMNASPGDKFTAVYHIKNTGTGKAQLSAYFSCIPSYPDLGTQIIVNSMKFDSKLITLPEGKTYGKATVAGLNGINLTLTSNLPPRMNKEKDFIIECVFAPVNADHNIYMGKSLTGSFIFSVK
ncbi:amidase enhancer precursor [Oxobacter pfennigii]|uniref:Amidase enhancer n=1 Tax=Oxobacter pfennigii TaxID=36849 RepID=A0A0P8WBQ0_9CLOT|nr:cell wall-binding repeat-containing protein [Oxobacter pfennigii]KPU45147.1 amidase enhancer precursor [Oxobacter pfennigii]